MAQEAFEDIVETFEFLDDWEDRYRHVIEMGKAMDPLSDAERIDTTKVEGCASQVWLVPSVDGQGGTATFSFRGDSDAMIVRGLIAVLHAALFRPARRRCSGGRCAVGAGPPGAERSPLGAAVQRAQGHGAAYPGHFGTRGLRRDA